MVDFQVEYSSDCEEESDCVQSHDWSKGFAVVDAVDLDLGHAHRATVEEGIPVDVELR